MVQAEALLLPVRRRPRRLAYLASCLCKCWPAYKAPLLFRVRRDPLFRVFLCVNVIVLPCVLFFFDYVTPQKEAVSVLTRCFPAR